MTQLTTTRLMKLTDEQAFEKWGNEQLPKLFGDVSGAEFTERNKAFIEFGGRVDVTVGGHSETAVQDRLLAAKKATMLVQGLAQAAVTLAASPVAEEAKGQARALGILGIFKEKLAGKRKVAPALESGQEPSPKKPKA